MVIPSAFLCKNVQEFILSKISGANSPVRAKGAPVRMDPLHNGGALYHVRTYAPASSMVTARVSILGHGVLISVMFDTLKDGVAPPSGQFIVEAVVMATSLS